MKARILILTATIFFAALEFSARLRAQGSVKSSMKTRTTENEEDRREGRTAGEKRRPVRLRRPERAPGSCSTGLAEW